MLLPKQVIALGRITAREPGRHAFSSIRIDRHNGRARARATDGRRAVMFVWDEPDAGEFPPIEGLSCQPVPHFAANVPAKTLADASRGIPSRIYKPILGYLLLDESNASVVRVAATNLDNVTRAQAKADEGAFPDFADIMPTPARDGTLYDPRRHAKCGFTHVRIGVNARQLAETLQVMTDLAGDDGNRAVVLTVPVSAARPIRLDARCPDRRAVAVVMPTEFTACDEEERCEPPAEPQAPRPSQITEPTAPRPSRTMAPRPRPEPVW